MRVKKILMKWWKYIKDFCNKYNCDLSILESGEHFFYTEDQLKHYKNWLDKVMQQPYEKFVKCIEINENLWHNRTQKDKSCINVLKKESNLYGKNK